MEVRMLLDRYDIVMLLMYLSIRLIDAERDDIEQDDIDRLNIPSDIFRRINLIVRNAGRMKINEKYSNRLKTYRCLRTPTEIR